MKGARVRTRQKSAAKNVSRASVFRRNPRRPRLNICRPRLVVSVRDEKLRGTLAVVLRVFAVATTWTVIIGFFPIESATRVGVVVSLPFLDGRSCATYGGAGVPDLLPKVREDDAIFRHYLPPVLPTFIPPGHPARYDDIRLFSKGRGVRLARLSVRRDERINCVSQSTRTNVLFDSGR